LSEGPKEKCKVGGEGPVGVVGGGGKTLKKIKGALKNSLLGARFVERGGDKWDQSGPGGGGGGDGLW